MQKKVFCLFNVSYQKYLIGV